MFKEISEFQKKKITIKRNLSYSITSTMFGNETGKFYIKRVENPTNLNYTITDTNVTITWTGIPTPSAIDTNYLKEYFSKNDKVKLVVFLLDSRRVINEEDKELYLNNLQQSCKKLSLLISSLLRFNKSVELFSII